MKRRLLLGFALLLFCSQSRPGLAEEAYPDPQGLGPGFGLSFLGGVNILSQFSVGSYLATSNHISYNLGLRGEYFFQKHVGVFIGTDLTNRGLSDSNNNSYTSGWLDIPFGVAFRYRWHGSDDGPWSYLGVGGFFAQPLSSSLSGSSAFSLGNISTKSTFGLILEARTMFSINPSWALGLGTWFKYGFGSSLGFPGTTASANLAELGLGLVVNFH